MTLAVSVVVIGGLVGMIGRASYKEKVKGDKIQKYLDERFPE